MYTFKKWEDPGAWKGWYEGYEILKRYMNVFKKKTCKKLWKRSLKLPFLHGFFSIPPEIFCPVPYRLPSQSSFFTSTKMPRVSSLQVSFQLLTRSLLVYSSFQFYSWSFSILFSYFLSFPHILSVSSFIHAFSKFKFMVSSNFIQALVIYSCCLAPRFSLHDWPLFCKLLCPFWFKVKV